MIEYRKITSPTKFETAEELAQFLTESYWWDREWEGLNYDKVEWQILFKKIYQLDARGIDDQREIKNKIIFPFWIKQLKQNYTFPLYFKRELIDADGYSTSYYCSILSKEEYNDFWREQIKLMQEDIEKIKKKIEE